LRAKSAMAEILVSVWCDDRPPLLANFHGEQSAQDAGNGARTRLRCRPRAASFLADAEAKNGKAGFL